jgi:hypothetical protein
MSSYRFLSFLRQGLGARRPASGTIKVVMRVAEQDVATMVSLYGPGDVAGIDPRMIVRREPSPRSSGFAPNFLACIELRRPDFPWMLSASTPEGPADQQKLMPWLCLVVFDETPPVVPHAAPGAPLPIVEPAFAELPLLDEIHAWAHVQLGDSTRAVDDILKASPELALARLICPRKLEPEKRYVACLVPTTEAGRLAGLGQEPQPGEATKLAWRPALPGRARLPVYDHWTFQTGPAGDFESVAERLRPHDLSDGFTPRALDVQSLLPDGSTPRQVAMFAALSPTLPRKAPSDVPAVWTWSGDSNQVATTKLTSWLAPIVSGTGTLQVGPPCYGDASRPTRNGVRVMPTWMATLNYDARYRAVAGLGARLVQLHQEELVAETHRHAGSLRDANRLIEGALFARSIAQRAFTKHFASLGDAKAIAVARPALARLDAGGGQSIAMTIAASTLGKDVVAGTFRRILHARARTPLVSPILAARAARAFTPPVPSVTSGALTRATLADRVAHPSKPYVLMGTTFKIPGAAMPAGPVNAPSAIPAAPPPTARQAQLIALMAAKPPPAPQIIAFVPPHAVALGPQANLVRAHLAPSASAPARLTARLQLGAAPPGAGATTATAPTSSLVADEELSTPVGDLLRALDPRLLISGGGEMPADKVAMLEVNPAFVEAILVGANHELVRELLWRGVPIDPRATLLRHFWPLGRQSGGDIKRLTDWIPDQPLGSAGSIVANTPKTVVVIRSELVRRFPDALVFLAPTAAGGDGPSKDESTYALPLFRGSPAPDLLYLGFRDDVATLRAGWYVIVQERPGAARFGFDDASSAGSDVITWMDLSWSRVPVLRKHVSLATAPPTPTSHPSTTWGWNAAHMAAIARQRPARIAIACADILPKPTSTP